MKDEDENSDGKQYQVDAILEELKNQLETMKDWKIIKKERNLKKEKNKNVNKIKNISVNYKSEMGM